MEPLPFDALDGLLEQAYDLDEPERSRFIAQLDPPQRDQLLKLLEVSSAVTLDNVASEVRAALGSESMPEQAPSLHTAGRWRLHRTLGAGGMGQVFYATREAPDGLDHDYLQEAAIKIMWSMKADGQVRARFIRERRLLASLDYPGLARFIDGGFLGDGRPWFAMEYVCGRPLDDAVRGQPVAEKLTLFKEICATVAHAHQHLIVHRDIKPSNILVDDAGRARLLDFGIAGVLEDIDDGVHTRSSGGPLTLQYASPEQLSGPVVTSSSDIYQLGLILYEMVAEAKPYDLADTPLSVALETVCRRTPPKPSTHAPHLDQELDAVVMTAIAKKPHQRYPSATALAEDIDRYLTGRPVLAVPQTLGYVTRRFLGRNLFLVSLVTLTALALSIATVVSYSMARQATEEAARSRAAQQILADVFHGADPFQAQGGDVTLIDALLRAKPDIEARVVGDPRLAWEVNLTLAHIYEGLGKVEAEREAFERALLAARALPDHGGDKSLPAIAGIGSVLARTHPAEAIQYLDKHLPDQPPSSAALSAWLDGQYARVGALSRTRDDERANGEARALERIMDAYSVEAPRKRGRLSQILAGVARRQGDGVAEERHWQDAVRFMRAADNPSALAITLSNWAIYLGRQGRFQASEAAFVEAIGIFESVDLQDPTYAGLMRAYGGLLFRTGRTEEARIATKKALSLLPTGTQFYARFVAELNLVQYAFVEGDLVETLEVLVRALTEAQRNLASDPQVPERMTRLFAKVMVFVDAPELAAVAVGGPDGRCRTKADLLSVLEALEHPKDQLARAALWTELETLESKARVGRLKLNELTAFSENYLDRAPPFFDALDEWRVLTRLSALSGQKGRLPAASIERLEALKAARTGHLRPHLKAELAKLAAFLGGEKSAPAPCR